MNYGSSHCVQMLQIHKYYKFLCNKDVAWYYKKAVTEYKNFEEKCKEYTKELNQKMKSIEATIQIKINITQLQKLQRK